MLYPNIIRPFVYFFMCKSQAKKFNEFARKFEELADVTEGKDELEGIISNYQYVWNHNVDFI